MSDPDNAPQLVDPRTQHPAYVVWRWLRITIAAVANVMVLALFSAYFDNQTLGLLEIISIIADAMGIVLGLLGIWFFFLSERLNRTAAINLELTTASVDVLKNQMWNMIQKTYNRFVPQENEEKIEEAREESREKLKELKEDSQNPEGVPFDKIFQALEAINKRVDAMDRQWGDVVSVIQAGMPIYHQELNTPTRPRIRTPSNVEMEKFIYKHATEFPMNYYQLIKKLNIDIGPISPVDLAKKYVNNDWFTIIDTTLSPGNLPDPKNIVDIGPVAMKVLPNNIAESIRMRQQHA